MGVWGYGVYDSDDAVDWLGSIESLLVKQVKKVLRNGSPNEVIAAAGLLAGLDKQPIDLRYDADRENLYYRFIDRLTRLNIDDGWVKTWDDPALIRLCLNALMLRLEAVAQSYMCLQKLKSHQAGHKAIKATHKVRAKPGEKRSLRRRPVKTE